MSEPVPASRRVPVRDDLAGVAPYGAPQLDVAVRLNTNETPYPPPRAFAERLAARLADLDLHRYPDRELGRLREALAAHVGVDAARVWAANGSNEVLAQLHLAYGGPGRRVLAARPGFPALPTIARSTGTDVAFVDLDAPGYDLDPEAAAAAVRRAQPHLVCLARPNNPTGTSVSLEAVRALHDAGGALVILDEAYVEFADDDGLALLDELPRLVLTRTLSKAFRLAGLRLGYLLADPWVLDDVRTVRLPYHLDAITQAAGLVACELAEAMTAHIPAIVAERERVAAALAARGDVVVTPSQANFLLVASEVDGLFDRLLERGVLVRDFADAPGTPGCVRVTIGTPEENDRFLSALEEALP